MIKKYLYFITIILLFSTTIHSQSEKNWYKCLAGTVGTIPVTMHLHKLSNAYTGYYYYNKTQQPIYMIGDDTSVIAGGKIRLYSFLPGNESNIETFVFSLNGNSCTGVWKKNENSKGLPFKATLKIDLPVHYDMLYIKDTVLLRPGMKESPVARYDAGTIWPRENSVIADSLRKFIIGTFDNTGSTADINKILLAAKDSFLINYLADNKDVADSEMVDYPYAFNMEESDWLVIAFQSAKLLTVADWLYTFSGGAHGNSGAVYYTFNLLTGKKLVLEDILLPGGIRKLNGLLEKYFRKANGLPPGGDMTEAGLFENKIERNSNYYITARGIGFSYNPYEIASYAVGEVNIFIPFTELNNYLQPAFKKLIL